ncbi:MAG: class I SAM-dependent methyltransferase [Calditrichaeota bacterium]|nr:class I SAM-dependent methyltransferase [Calditrichota bacterium]
MKSFFKELASLMHQADPEARFVIRFWDGDSVHYGESPEFTLNLTSKRAAQQITGNGFLGFGEAYMAQQLDIDGSLEKLLRLGLSINFEDHKISTRRKIEFLLKSFINRGTLRRAPHNIKHHYDRGNEFYKLYLDKSMTYSCAYFKTPEDSLEVAQDNKHEHICRKLQLKLGESLVDIGCGWGGMLIYAARHYDITGVGCTLSRNQFEYANSKITEQNLQKQIQVVYQDYRDIKGKFDKFVSIGMFEHVGKRYFPVFFTKVRELLKKGGLGLLHNIGKDTPSKGDPWTLKYIFPGGYIPTISEMTTYAGKAGFSILDVENLRLHYARTLDCWLENYEWNIEKVKKLIDESFVRRWRLFLASSAAGFRYGESRLFQMLFSNGLDNDLSWTRDHIYV